MIHIFVHSYDNITSIENLLIAWKNFKKSKTNKKDVQIFERNLMDNIFGLYKELKIKKYKHLGYFGFKITDPKSRNIHKALVRDRVVHHLLYQHLYPYFDPTFIHDSYSCRLNKGTHKAIQRFQHFIRKVTKNNTKQCFVLKCDIKKFFASIDHKILKNILEKHIQDKDILNLLSNIIDSFDKGLPLGNLTSQLLVNIYMNEFDQYVKHKLKVKYYIRYADDFVILNEKKEYLEETLQRAGVFLSEKLLLQLHPNKVFIKTIYSGVDFLGWVHFGKHRVLRTATKKRMMRNLKNNMNENTKASYLGMLKWGNGFNLSQNISKTNFLS